MSAPVVDLPPMFGRVEQCPAPTDAEVNPSPRTTTESVPPVGPVASPGGTTPPPARDEMVVERSRIAFGVNDTVIRHLFSIGLSLHTTRTMVSEIAQVRLDVTIGELDIAISELRSVIFDLKCGPTIEH